MSPLAALKAATSVAGRVLRMEIGRIEPGQRQQPRRTRRLIERPGERGQGQHGIVLGRGRWICLA